MLSHWLKLRANFLSSNIFLKDKKQLQYLMIHIKEKARFHRFFSISFISQEHYTVEVTDDQSWPNYIGPKRGTHEFVKPACVYTLFPVGGVVWIFV